MKVPPINALSYCKSKIRTSFCLLAGVLTIGIIGMVKENKKNNSDPATMEEYNKTLAEYNRASIMYNNTKKDSTEIKQHLYDLYKMKDDYKQILANEIKNIDLYSDDQIAKKDGVYNNVMKAISRSKNDVDIATGAQLKSVKNKLDSLKNVHANK